MITAQQAKKWADEATDGFKRLHLMIEIRRAATLGKTHIIYPLNGTMKKELQENGYFLASAWYNDNWDGDYRISWDNA